MEDLGVQSYEQSFQRLEADDVFALVGRTRRPERRPRSTGRTTSTNVRREHESAELLHARTKEIRRLLRALDPRELPATLRARAYLDGAGAAQVVDTREDVPDGLLLWLADTQGAERRDYAIEFYLSALLVLVLLQRSDEGVVLGDEVREVELLAQRALGAGKETVGGVESWVAVHTTSDSGFLQ